MATFRQKPVAAKVSQRQAKNAVQAVVFAGQREAVRRVPRDTSVLANSIQGDVTVLGTRVRGTIGTNVSYAAPVEFGTHSVGEPDAPGKRSFAPGGMRPRPYLRPGLTAGLAYAKRKGLIK